MHAIANGGSQNIPEPLSCRGSGGIVEKTRLKGTETFLTLTPERKLP